MIRHTPAPILDIAAEIPGFGALARTTVRLHPRRGKSSIDASKMGGSIVWPADETWPTCEEHDSALVPVLQLTADDIPELGFPPGTDLFQLLWCPIRHERLQPLDGPAARAFWRKRAEVRKRLVAIPSPVVDRKSDEYWPAPCILSPERIVEYPALFQLDIENPDLRAKLEESDALQEIVASLEGAYEEVRTIYSYWLSVAEGTKVGGYPHWIQDPEWPQCECGARMQYLLTVSSAEWDGGNWNRWLPAEDRHVRSARYDIRIRVQCAANLMLGDMGNINYFICRNCPGCSIEGIFQCS
jgi:hypothetical protein